MPPRKGKKKAGARTAALIRAAFEDTSVDKADTVTAGRTLSPQEAEEKLAQMIQGMKDKVELRCTTLMDNVEFVQQALLRGLATAKSGVPERYGNMNLLKYCEEYGEDYEQVLFAALTPKQQEAFLSEFNGEDGEDDNDENDPGTTIKGKRPAPLKVAETPAGTRRAGGRALRSAVNATPQVEAPMTRSRRGGRATAAAKPPPSTRARRGATRGAAAAKVQETTVTEHDQSGTEAVKATPGPAGRRRAAKARGDFIKQSVKESLYGDDTVQNEGVLLKPRAREELRKSANSKHTMYEHLEALVDKKLQETPKTTEAQCNKLRAEWKRGTDEMLAKLRAALPSEDNQEEAGGGLVAAGEGRGGMMRGGVLAVSRGSATVRLTAEGGPYDGKMFEVLVEEDGDARLIGRSSSKKFKQKGVSLPKDTEVSTTHGKLENSAGKLTFTDLGSTNGTEVDGVDADEEQPYHVADGSKLLIGQATFTLSITWER